MTKPAANNYQKYYLLDTSVILDDPENLLRLYDQGNNYLFTTNIVLSEIDGKKDDVYSEAGHNAREFHRIINADKLEILKVDNLPKDLKEFIKNKEEANDIIKSDNYCKIILDFNETTEVPLYIITRKEYKTKETISINDNKILEMAVDYDMTLITNDFSFRLNALSKKMKAIPLSYNTVDDPEHFEYIHTIEYKKGTTEEELHKKVGYKKLSSFSQIVLEEMDIQEDGTKYKTGIIKFALWVDKKLEYLDFDNINTPVELKNYEQKFYYYILKHPKSEIITVSGATGSGKTLVALMVAVELIEEHKDIEGIIYTRNTVTATDKHSELGYRKGDENQKLNYFMYPLFNAVNFMLSNKTENDLKKKGRVTLNEVVENVPTKEIATDEFMKKYKIETIDIAHTRGITITKKIFILDEAQNLSNKMLKLIGTRIGENAKIIILGDFKQIDHPNLSRKRNALVTMLKKAKDFDNIAGVKLKKTIRSKTADWFDKNL